MGRTHKKSVLSLRYSLRPLQLLVSLATAELPVGAHEKSLHVLSVLQQSNSTPLPLNYSNAALINACTSAN